MEGLAVGCHQQFRLFSLSCSQVIIHANKHFSSFFFFFVYILVFWLAWVKRLLNIYFDHTKDSNQHHDNHFCYVLNWIVFSECVGKVRWGDDHRNLFQHQLRSILSHWASWIFVASRWRSSTKKNKTQKKDDKLNSQLDLPSADWATVTHSTLTIKTKKINK